MSGLVVAKRAAWAAGWRWEEGTNVQEEGRPTRWANRGWEGGELPQTSRWDLVFLSKEQWEAPTCFLICKSSFLLVTSSTSLFLWKPSLSWSPRGWALGLPRKPEKDGHKLTHNVLTLSSGLKTVGFQLEGVPHRQPAGRGGVERDRKASPQSDGGDTTAVLGTGTLG